MKEFALYELVESLAGKMIKEQRNLQKNVCANVDFYSGFCVFYAWYSTRTLYANLCNCQNAGMERTPTGRVDKCEQNYPSGLQICGDIIQNLRQWKSLAAEDTDEDVKRRAGKSVRKEEKGKK